MIEVYNDCKEETTLPQPQLKLEVDGKSIYIHAVDKDGKRIASIWVVVSNGETCFHLRAKQDIEDHKHSTDWAEWDEDGRFVKLK